MKKTLLLAAALACASLALAPAAARADDVKIGALMDVTGPIASFIPPLHSRPLHGAALSRLRHDREYRPHGGMTGRAVAQSFLRSVRPPRLAYGWRSVVGPGCDDQFESSSRWTFCWTGSNGSTSRGGAPPANQSDRPRPRRTSDGRSAHVKHERARTPTPSSTMLPTRDFWPRGCGDGRWWRASTPWRTSGGCR